MPATALEKSSYEPPLTKKRFYSIRT